MGREKNCSNEAAAVNPTIKKSQIVIEKGASGATTQVQILHMAVYLVGGWCSGSQPD
jgi:hypothetical protein